jgi:hypothetical protein
VNFEQVLEAALALTPIERARLMGRIMESLEPHLRQSPPQGQQSRKSLYDLWQDLNLPPEDMDELRRGVWEGFGNASLRDTSNSEGDGASKAFPAADDDIG